MAKFKVIEEGAFADYEFEAEADSREELFKICAIATFEAMTDVSKVKPERTIEFEATGETDEELLYAFLAELIYIKDVQRIFLSEFKITIEEKFKLKCEASGEIINPGKHELRTDVKAVTYHRLEFKETDKGYSAHAILDL